MSFASKQWNAFAEQYDISLDEQQTKAVQAKDGTILLLAVPGSGKTTTLITRLGYMTQSLGIAPETILAITYTVAGTNHMREVFSKRFGSETGRRITFRTINALSWEIVRSYYESRHRAISVLDEKEQRKILRQLFKEVNHDAYPQESDLMNAQSYISYIKNLMLSKEDIRSHAWDVEHFPELYQRYSEVLVKQKYADFDDMMRFALTILNANPAILKQIQNRYQYIFVDEAQDTSLLQHEILKLLSAEHHNLFLVGDEDQSIYGYRGAFPKALLRISDYYPDTRVLKLETNYRSKREIVARAKAFIDRNPDRIPKDMKPFRSENGSVQTAGVSTRGEQLSALKKYIHTSKKETAVLYRNNDSLIPIIDHFERNQIPYVINKGKDTFFSSRIVTDIRSFLEYALDPENEDLFLRCCMKVSMFFKRETAENAIRWRRRKHTPLLEEFVNQNHYLKGMRKFQIDSMVENAEDFQDTIESLPTMRPASAIKAIMKLGYEDYLRDHELGSGTVEQLIMIAEHTDRIQAFLDRLKELQTILSNRLEEKSGSGVILSTIHSAKGMEFSRVILFDMFDGILPGTKPDEDEALYFEERRLFYVAVTRAKDELIVLRIRQKDTSFADELLPKQEPPKQAAPSAKPKPAPKKPSASGNHEPRTYKILPGPAAEEARSLRAITECYPQGSYLFLEHIQNGKQFQICILSKSRNTIDLAAWDVDPQTGEVSTALSRTDITRDPDSAVWKVRTILPQ